MTILWTILIGFFVGLFARALIPGRDIVQAYIQKWGNSFGLRIPMQLAKQLKLHQGSAVTIEIEDGRMIIQAPKYDLDIMLDEITPKNRHHQILDDERQGNEEW